MDNQFHCHVNNLSRRKREGGERSAVAAAAYISGTALWNERERKITNFGNRRDVAWSELLTPPDAPAWTQDREQLWNLVDGTARRKDARLAKTIEAALARDIPRKQWVKLLRDFVAPYVAEGMVADIAIHDDGTGHNPHVHVLLTVRSLKPNGFGPKITNVDHRNFVTTARRGWETISNKYLEAAGSSVRLDRRSYKARGIQLEPTKHRGPNQAERRLKRAAARMHHLSAGDTMTRQPADEERGNDPLPMQDDREGESRIPATDEVKRESHRRRQIHRANEEARMTSRAGDRYDPKVWEEASPHEEPQVSERPWYETALANAKREAHRNRDPAVGRTEDTQTFEQDLAARHAEYERSVLQRAAALEPTPEEQELTEIARNASPEVKAHIDNLVLEQQIRRIRDEDDAERLARFERQIDPALRTQYDAYMAEQRESAASHTPFEPQRDEDEQTR